MFRAESDSRSNLRRRYGSESDEVVDGVKASSSSTLRDSYAISNPGATTVSAGSDRGYFDSALGTPASSTLSSSCAMNASCRDRTTEFVSAVRSLQGRQMNGGVARSAIAANVTRNAQLAQQSAEFMKIARSIGRDITSTYTKLEKLTLLARRKTLFDDRPQEIQELTHIIKEDMSQLNRQIGQLQQIARAQRGLGLQGRHQQSHSSSVVVALQSKLAAMTSNFKEVLEVRTENLKESKNRQEMFSKGAVTSSLPQSAVYGFHSGSVLAAASSSFAAEDDERQHVSISMGDALGANQSLMQASHDMTHDYLQSRASTMQSIESTIVELGGIFSQLAHMIKEQEEIMVRIDSNVEDAAMNVEAGHSEILKYFQSVTSNRWLMIKIFGVLIFFFIFFVIFMA